MDNYFKMDLTRQQIDAFSNLALAHIGDGVYELLCRSYLCSQGVQTVGNLHKDTVKMVKAPTQALMAEKILPHLTEDELTYYRRGKNAHVHAVPKGATPAEYSRDSIIAASTASGDRRPSAASLTRLLAAWTNSSLPP